MSARNDQQASYRSSDDASALDQAKLEGKNMRIEGRLLLWLIPAAMLLVALAPWPYGYYQLLRVVVCICCGVLAYQSCERDGLSPWTIGLVVVAVVFNPIVPIHLTRAIWAALNVMAASFLLGHMYIEQGRKP